MDQDDEAHRGVLHFLFETKQGTSFIPSEPVLLRQVEIHIIFKMKVLTLGMQVIQSCVYRAFDNLTDS